APRRAEPFFSHPASMGCSVGHRHARRLARLPDLADWAAFTTPAPPEPPAENLSGRCRLTHSHLEVSLNLAWVLLAGCLVMFMQAGFAMVETGFTRSKNAVHTMAMNFVIYPLGILGFWLVGYAVLSGGVTRWPSLGASDIGARE